MLTKLTKLTKLKEEFISLVYPRSCVFCGVNGVNVDSADGFCACYDCVRQIEKPSPPFCPRCGKTVPADFCEGNARQCAECARLPFVFSRGYTASYYNGLMRDCIHRFKYEGGSHIGRTLGYFMADFAKQHIDLSSVDVLAYVPMHWKRKRDRGFNQSEMLAEIIGRRVKIRVVKGGMRHKGSDRPQMELNHEERIKNIAGVFGVSGGESFRKARILLIDDVFTTGATLNECAQVLLDAGAEDVRVFSLSRTITS